MEKQDYKKLFYGERIKWIAQQLKDGKNLEEILDTKVIAYQQKVPRNNIINIELPQSEAGTLTCEVNLEVIKRWEQFTSVRPQKAETLISMALWEFMSNHI